MDATYRSALRHPTYGRLFAAQVVALTGTGLLTVALSLLAFEIAPGSAGAVMATALTIKMVAYVVLTPLVTAITSRWAPRTVLVGADLVRIAAAVVLPWVSETWHIYALVFVLQAASATFTPTFQAIIPTVLPQEAQYTRALSLSRLAYDLEAVASPVLAATLLLVMNFNGLFAGTAAGFALSAALVLSARLRVAGAPPTTSFSARAFAGMRMFATRRRLQTLLLLEVAAACATATVLVNTVVVVRQQMSLGPSELALTLGAFGVGSMASALGLPRLLDRRPALPVMAVGGVVTVVALAGATAITTGPWWAVLAVWASLGAATSAVLTPAGGVVNSAVASEERPAAYAAHFSLSHACYLLAYPLAGRVGERVSVAASAAVLAAVAAVATAGAALLVRALREERVRASE